MQLSWTKTATRRSISTTSMSKIWADVRHIGDPDEQTDEPEARADICVELSPLEDEWESSLPDMKTTARVRLGYLTDGQFFVALGADERMCPGCLSLSLHMLADLILEASEEVEDDEAG